MSEDLAHDGFDISEPPTERIGRITPWGPTDESVGETKYVKVSPMPTGENWGKTGIRGRESFIDIIDAASRPV